MTVFPNPPSSSPASPGGDDLNLQKLIGTLLDRKWLIISLTLLAMLVGYFYASSQTRIFQADALVQIENNGSRLGLLETLGVGDQAGNPTTAELEILQSRMVMGEVAGRLDLAIRTQPRRLPVVGEFLSNHGFTHEWFDRLTPNFLLNWLPGVSSDGWRSPYVWSTESLGVARFDVPAESVGLEHVLRATGGGGFELLLEDQVLLTGQVGETVQDEALGYRIFISQLEMHPGAEYKLWRVTRLSAISQLQRRLMILPRGADSGVFQLFLSGPDRDEIPRTLDTLTSAFLTQNVQRQSEEAEKQIEFLDAQIPQVNAQLTEAENRLNEYRAQRESVDLTFETENLLNRVVAVENQLSELALAEADLSERFRPTHPNYQALLRQRAQLREERDQLSAQVDELPETQQEVLRLTRDTQVNQQVYVQLLNQRQEMRLVKAGTVGNVRILDPAVLQPGTIAPRVPLTTMVSGLLGMLLVAAAVIVRQLLSRSVKSPDQLEELGLPVYATLPDSGEQSKLTSRIRPRGATKGQDVFRGLLATSYPREIAVEALRGLRTSLHFAMLESDDNRLMIAGSSPGVGKSFIAANLATVCAQAGQRVLLIDADMRRGHLHLAFHDHSEKGLSELLARRIEVDEAIRHTEQEGLDYVARGTVPPNPSELLTQRSFSDFLDEMSGRYDLVVLDTPPVLAVTDAVVVGKLVGTSLVVVRFGLNPPAEIKAAKRRLENAGVRLKGAILNGVEKHTSSRYGYYGSYLYAYR